MKKKIISMVLALTLVVSGLPATSANAAELENVSCDSIWALDEETDETETVEDATAATVTGEQDGVVEVTADYSSFNVNADGKVVGSDGVSYDDITYLSFNTVSVLDADTQDAYVELCDIAADWAESGIENIVLAVDDEGTLCWSYHVPSDVFVESQQELVEAVLEAEPETATEEESTVEETTTEEESTAEETTAEEESTVEETTAEEESTVEETAAEEESTVEETATEEESTVEETTEVIEEEAVVFHAENMELLPELVNEQVELADDVEVTTIDLGYGNAATFNSSLPSESYFSGQLKGNAKKIYSVAKGRLTTGNTTFAFSGGSTSTLSEDVSDAISAVVLTYTEKVDWFDPQGGWSASGKVTPTGAIISCTIQVDKSAYYSSSLDSQANARVAALANNAQEYAVENYPLAPAYGVVAYLDKWICENNYYNTPGGVSGTLGNDVYYYCHSAYGSLLKGYAVCESYAKAMSRLLDAVGIPNMYVIGDVPGAGGHAWNYVQMPDGVWYLLDSTWNNPSTSASDAYKTSTKEYLLVPDDGYHVAEGKQYNGQKNGFKFVKLGDTKYAPATGKLEFNEGTQKTLVVKEKFKLSVDSAEVNNTYATWSSSDTSVAKVDKKGNVTAVAPGTATITLSTIAVGGIEMKTSCKVSVYQVKGLTVARNGKTSDTVSLGTNGKATTVALNVNVGEKSPYTAQQLVENKFPISNAKNAAVFSAPEVKSAKTDIATAEAALTGNTINVAITPKSAGSTSITVTFGGKKATIKVTVGDLIDKSMFVIDWAGAGVDEKTMSVDYTGKAIAPKVTANDKSIKFKKTYLNNKNAGTASLIISGTGKYGGEIRYDFKINKLTIDAAHIDTAKLSKASNTYNGGSNPAKLTVKYLNSANKKVSLKATDYDVIYHNGTTMTTSPVNVGTYKVTISGKGNYQGSYTLANEYTIAPCEISKAKVAFTYGKKPTEPKVKTTVSLGKNVLSTSDYTIKYYSDKKCTTEVAYASLKAKTQYYAQITAKGSNVVEPKNGKTVVKSFKTK